MTKIDFHVLGSTQTDSRYLHGCKLIEKAVQRGMEVCVLVDDHQQAQEVSETLWQFKDEAFIPHGINFATEDAVQINVIDNDHHFHDVLINLTNQKPPQFSQYQRLFEVVIQHDDVLSATRDNYRFYKDRGYEVTNQKIG